MKPVVSARNLEFSRPTGFKLSIKELEIFEGEKVFLSGASGSGKSTFLSLVAGLFLASRGTVRVLESDLAQMTSSERDEWRAQNLGVIFQSFNLVPYLSLLENILLADCFHSKSRDVDFVENELKAFGLWEKRHQTSANLSVGEQQRVAYLRAIYNQPKLLIGDEPTSALDEKNETNLLSRLFQESEKRGITLIFASHHQHLAKRFDRQISVENWL